MSNKLSIISVLFFPYDNQLEVRVSRAYAFNSQIYKVNIYHAKYNDLKKAKSLIRWTSKLNELVMIKRIEEKAFTKNPTI